MHVAYLVNQYPKVSHTFIRREIRALEEAGIQVSRFAVRTDGTESVDPLDAEEHAKTRYILQTGASGLASATLGTLLRRPARFLGAFRLALSLGRRSSRGILHHLIYLAEACMLQRWLNTCGATHLHAHFGTNSTTVAMLCRAVGGVPYSFTVHGPEEFDMPISLALRDKVGAAAFVVAISSFCRSQIYRWADVQDWPKIHIVRCALDATYLADESGPATSSRRIVCVGRLSPEKGHLLLIQAFSALVRRGNDVELVPAGDGPSRAQIERTLQQSGLQSRVRITGWIDSAQVRTEILGARALVLASFAEGLPVVIMEACALGRPVICTQIAGIPELVRDQESGWLIPSGDADALAAALESAVTASDDTLARMAESGRRRVRAMHDVNVEAAKLAALFRAVE